MFSATINNQVESVILDFLSDAYKITVGGKNNVIN
jgi:hypothetical protein